LARGSRERTFGVTITGRPARSAAMPVLFLLSGSRLSGQRVAPAGQKTHFGPLSKNNIGMAALRAGLPVIITPVNF